MRALIVSGGYKPSDNMFLDEVKKAQYLIAADRGAEVFIKNNIKPDLVVGDFDSIGEEFKESLKDFNLVKFNPEKDFTDSEIAFNKALEKGVKEIVLLGVTGSRLDHAFGNIGLLKKALDKNIKAYIKDNNNIIFLTNKPINLKGTYGQTISFHAYCDIVKKFNIRKAKYSLYDYDLHLGESRAISNEFLNEDIEITFEEGIIMVVYSRD